MPLIVDEEAVRSSSRPAAIAMVLFAMRFMENWKRDVEDYDRAMILVAVAAITAERLLRSNLEPDEARLDRPVELERLAKCNVSSIASATGINRETARRKVNALVKQGLLRRLDDGTVAFTSGILQQDSTLELVRRQIDTVARLANDLMRMGVLTAK